MTITLAKLVNSTVAFAVASAATLVIVASSAAPVAASQTRSTATINLGGIDLASPAGEARIAKAVGHAARQVCSTGADRGIRAARDRRACIDTALATALPQLAQRAEAARAARPQLADITPPTGPVSR